MPEPTRRSPAILASLALILFLLLTAFVALLRPAAAPAAGDATPITTATPLTWGFKTSWRNYVPVPEVGDGAEVLGGGATQIYDLRWAFESGSYDAEAGTTQLDYKGTVHWQKYKASALGYTAPPGYSGEPDPFILDVTISDPQITISKESSVITAVVSSRRRATWQIVDYGRVPIVNLNVLGVTPNVADGQTSWSGIHATVSEAANEALERAYPPGQAVDDVEFSYEGPGGAPDFSEHFDLPGSPKLQLVKNELFVDGDTPIEPQMPPWIDQERLLVHEAVPVTEGGVETVHFETFSLRQMKTVGRTLVLPAREAPQPGNIVAVDSNGNRLLYHLPGEEGITRQLAYDPDTGEYTAEAVGDPTLAEPAFVGGANGTGLAWDPELDLGYRLVQDPQCIAGKGPECAWSLLTYKEEAGGDWTRTAYPVEGFGPGQTGGYANFYSLQEPSYATASDGSLIVLATKRKSSNSGNPAPSTAPGAWRLTLDQSSGQVTREALPVEVANGAAGLFTAVQTSAHGRILLIRGGEVVECDIVASGTECQEAVPLGSSVDTGGGQKPWQYAVDPADGTVWFAGVSSKEVAAARDGKLLGGQVFGERNPKGGPIVVGEDHTVYVQTNDGSAAEVKGTKAWGWGEYELLGHAPTVTADPGDASVSLAEGEGSSHVTFTSAAAADPDPHVQWQQKAPGAALFTDVPGADEPDLAVTAEPGMGGTEYRAVWENAAGRVASEPATLSVEYSPRIGFDLANVTATEGQSATFSILGEGDPAPEITWERRVEGFWQPISATDRNFTIEGDSLTIKRTNIAQSGAMFQATLTNPVGSVTSREARLTVNPKTTVPAGGIAVTHASLDWVGNLQMQGIPHGVGANYFSAGTSDGKEDGYHSVLGNAAVWQVSSTGSETLATYATRAAHATDGGEQLARLYDGTGRVEPDGSADIRWDADFSVNFYGGLVPFTIEDPELKIEPGGAGTLTATLVGCASSMAEINVCKPLAPATDVVVANFTGATVEPGKILTVEPAYRGIAVDVPSAAGTQQLRSGPDWGAWPQSFVDFQLQTGLSSYWYSSGEEDEKKVPLPFTVNLEAPEPPASEPPPRTDTGGGGAGGGASAGEVGTAPTTQPGSSKAKGKPAKMRLSRSVRLDRKGAAKVAVLACPKGGAGSCETIVAARVATRIGARRYLIGVSAPKRIKAGHSAAVKVTLPRGARTALGHGKVTLRLRIAVRSGRKMTSRVSKVTIVGRG